MLLADIRNYVQQHRQRKLMDITHHFDITQDAAQFALQYWVKQGKIRQQVSCGTGGCGGSCRSSCAHTDQPDMAYEWVMRESVIGWMPHS